jgi:hypothetical protein
MSERRVSLGMGSSLKEFSLGGIKERRAPFVERSSVGVIAARILPIVPLRHAKVLL